MTVAMLWMLIGISMGDQNRGTPNNLGYFVKAEECAKVKASAEALSVTGEGWGAKHNTRLQCVQAEVAVVK